MSPWTTRAADRLRRILLLSCLLVHPPVALGALGPGPSVPGTPPDAAPQRHWLALRLNGVAQPDDASVLHWRDRLWLQASRWSELRLKAPTADCVDDDGDRYCALDTVPGLDASLEDATQTLVLQAGAGAFTGQQLSLDRRPARLDDGAERGGFLNYDAFVQRTSLHGAGSRQVASLLAQAGTFAGASRLEASSLVRADDRDARALRLDTTWSMDLPERMQTVRVGDAIGHPGGWGRAVRFGGVQWGTNLATAPRFLTIPLPAVRGEAVLPSSLEVFVNDGRRLQGRVEPGAFELQNVPLVTGRGEIRVVTRDLLGREQVVVQPYYVSPSLLRSGLHTHSVEVGLLRRDYGLRSDAYGEGFVTGTDRWGVNDRLTAEWRGEVRRDTATAGASATWLLPALGTVSGTVAGSRSPAGTGGLVGVAAEHQSRDWSGNVQWRQRSAGFDQLGADPGSAARRLLGVGFGTQVGIASLNLLLSRQDSPLMGRQRLWTASAALPLTGTGLLAFTLLGSDGDRGRRTLSAGISLSWALDDGTTLSAGSTRWRGDDGRHGQHLVQAQRNAPMGDGTGWRLAADATDGRSRAVAEGVWQHAAASLRAGVARNDRSDEARAAATGSVAWLGRDVFFSRWLDGSFAVVDVGDYEGVQVLLDHHPVARTDARGRAIVPGLRAYDDNRLGLELKDLPFDAELDAAELQARPRARAGVRVQFPVRRVRAASFRLVQADGSAVPPGSRVRVVGDHSGTEFPVGLDGRSFVSGVSSHTVLQVQSPGRRCEVTIDRLAERTNADEPPELGTLTCR
ncbi:fimbria/pilus outer membrane usher protein [Aquabacterium sp. J223]|uniref:fimbria/pilus outer membrane usher protein n=1 Tax=Aquabacterium sp. J223 TaxID=2898431 RepID=UPI0021AD7A6B|nr:fimbria/pilus outer membrane usher protein [Aquabacterium sp. J223]UUX97689.1 fimbria/pilus outer membrane usher protein [Aquabacterium sp. J223]